MFGLIEALVLLVSQAAFLQAAAQVSVFEALSPLTFSPVERPVDAVADAQVCAFDFQVEFEPCGQMDGEIPSNRRPKTEDVDAGDARPRSGEVIIEHPAESSIYRHWVVNDGHPTTTLPLKPELANSDWLPLAPPPTQWALLDGIAAIGAKEGASTDDASEHSIVTSRRRDYQTVALFADTGAPPQDVWKTLADAASRLAGSQVEDSGELNGEIPTDGRLDIDDVDAVGAQSRTGEAFIERRTWESSLYRRWVADDDHPTKTLSLKPELASSDLLSLASPPTQWALLDFTPPQDVLKTLADSASRSSAKVCNSSRHLAELRN